MNEGVSSDKLWHVPTKLLQVCHHCIPEALVMWCSTLSYCPIWHHKQWFRSLLLQGVVSKIWNITLIEMYHWATGTESVKCLAPGLFQLLFTDCWWNEIWIQTSMFSVFLSLFSLGHRNTRILFLFSPQNAPFQVDSYLSL